MNALIVVLLIGNLVILLQMTRLLQLLTKKISTLVPDRSDPPVPGQR